MIMKKYFMMAIAAIAAMTMTVSCDSEYAPDTFLGEATVSSSYLSFTPAGSTTEMTVKAASKWELIDVPEWLTAVPMNGEAGETTVKFTATEASATREGAIKLLCNGKTQIINLIQMCEKVEPKLISCAEVASADEGATVRTKGVVTAIANTQYGNFYLNDGTGEVYVYGTLFDGKTQNNPIANNKIEVGDEVTVEGPKKNYNGTIELVDVTVVKVEKSLIKCDSTLVAGVNSNIIPLEGGELIAAITCKGSSVSVEIPADAQEWLSVVGVSNTQVKFRAIANNGGDRGTTIELHTTDGKKDYSTKFDIVQKGSVVAVSAAEFNALADDANAQYTVRGIITSIVNDTYGNLYINDGTGEVYVYGVLDAAGAPKNFASLGLKVGDEVVFQSVKTSYKDAPQMKNAIVVESVAHDVVTVEQFLAAAQSETVYYVISGTVVEATGEGTKNDMTTYGNFSIQDETGTVYVYGVLNNLKDKANKQFGTLGVELGDKITLLGYRTSYKGLNQVGGAIFIKNEKPQID